MPVFIGVEDALKLLGCSKRTLYRKYIVPGLLEQHIFHTQHNRFGGMHHRAKFLLRDIERLKEPYALESIRCETVHQKSILG